MLAHVDEDVEGRVVSVSGSGNVALHCLERLIAMGADLAGFTKVAGAMLAYGIVWARCAPPPGGRSILLWWRPPASARASGSSTRGTRSVHGAFLWQRITRDWTNLSLLRHRRYDGFLVSMHQSGTHWLKHLLAMLICRLHDVEPPAHLDDNAVVGHPRSPPVRPGIPHLVHSHNIPSPLVHALPARSLVRFPPYVILIRDLRASLVAHYERWKRVYGVPFSEYLRGDPRGRRFDKDIWWDVRFLNAWGRVVRALPGRTLVLRYEDLRRDPAAKLAEVWRFLGQPEAPGALLEEAVAASSKDAMSGKQVLYAGLPVVRADDRSPLEWYGDADRAFFERTCRRHLAHDFGYEYADWSGARRRAP